MIDAVRNSLDSVWEILTAELTNSPRLIRQYTADLAIGSGKQLRAATVLTVAYDEDTDSIDQDAVLMAVAIELVHLASLVHDDVIDLAPLRRGWPTLHSKYGNKIAVLTGDYLLARALAVAARCNTVGYHHPSENLRHYVERVCIGEIDEQKNLFELHLSLRDLLRIIEGKTAAMFEGSVVAGALVRKTTPTQLEAYRRFGRELGMVFQLMDDYLDYISDEKSVGKPVNSDMAKGVMTLPLYFALKEKVVTGEQLQQVWHLNEVNDDSPEQKARINEILRLVKGSNALRRTKNLINRHEAMALRHLAATGATGEKRQALIELLDLAMRKRR